MTRTIGPTPHGRRALVVACSLALAVLAGQDAHARFGDLDPSFGGSGAVVPGVGTTGQLEAVTTRPDGRPVAAGSAAAEGVVVQLTNAGAGDPGFGSSGITRFTTPGATTRLHGIALDASGRVLVAGDQQVGANTTAIARRLSATGDVDQTFDGTIGGSAGEAHAIHPLADGTALVAGWRLGAQGGQVFFVARLTSTGQLDGNFGVEGIVELPLGSTARAEAMAVDATGSIVVAGSTATQPVLARFLPTGAVDPDFGTGGALFPLAAGQLRAVRIDGAGRIVAAGRSGTQAFVTRRLATGAPDATFGTGGATVGVTAELNDLALVGDRPFVAGVAGAAGMLLGALGPTGMPDAGFGGNPPGWRTVQIGGSRTAALAIAPGPSGTLYSAGQVGQLPFVARTLPNAPPIAALAAPAGATTGATVTFDAGGSSDSEGEALRYAFDLDGDGTFELDRGASPVAARSFADPGVRTVRVRVSDPRGAAAVATRSIAISAPAPPSPVLGKQGVARPLRGVVRFRLPGTRRFVRMRGLTAIPNGTEIDARKGRILLTVLHDASGRLDRARFYAGRFVFRQGKGRTPLTNLKLSGGSFAACGARAPAAAAGEATASRTAVRRRKRVRRLWGDGKGRFRTRGRYGAGTVRGTKWLTQDRCDGTLVRVTRGKVAVERVGPTGPQARRPAPPRLVRAGERTLVRAKGGG